MHKWIQTLFGAQYIIDTYQDILSGKAIISDFAKNLLLSQVGDTSNAALVGMYQFFDMSKNIMVLMALIAILVSYIYDSYQQAQRMMESTGAVAIGVLFQTFVKYFLTLMVIMNAVPLMTTVYNTIVTASASLSNSFAPQEQTAALNNLADTIEQMSIGDIIGAFFIALLIRIVALIVWAIVNVTIVVSVLEMYLWISLAPAALAMLSTPLTSQTGINYIRNVVAYGLRPLLTMVAVNMMTSVIVSMSDTSSLSTIQQSALMMVISIGVVVPTILSLCRRVVGAS